MSTPTGSSSGSGRRARGAASKTSRRRLAAAERAAECYRLYAVEGLSLSEVARRMGYAGHEGAAKAVRAASASLCTGVVEEARRVAMLRAEERRAKLRPLAFGRRAFVADGTGRAAVTYVDALEALRKEDEREARLLGLDAPVKSEVKATLTEADALALVDEVIGILRDVLRRHEGEALTAERIEAIHAEIATRILAAGGEAPPAS